MLKTSFISSILNIYYGRISKFLFFVFLNLSIVTYNLLNKLLLTYEKLKLKLI